MSLLSAIILPHLEKQLLEQTPEIAQTLVQAVHGVGNELVKWAEGKLNMDVNGDGKIGDGE